jgi:hypothetical protein
MFGIEVAEGRLTVICDRIAELRTAGSQSRGIAGRTADE